MANPFKMYQTFENRIVGKMFSLTGQNYSEESDERLISTRLARDAKSPGPKNSHSEAHSFHRGPMHSFRPAKENLAPWFRPEKGIEGRERFDGKRDAPVSYSREGLH